MVKAKVKRFSSNVKIDKLNMKRARNSMSKIKTKPKPLYKQMKKKIIPTDFYQDNNSSTSKEILEVDDDEEQSSDSQVVLEINENFNNSHQNLANISDNETSSDEDEAEKHKRDLEKLRESDPDFYKFLQENDEKLLQFNLTDDEDNLETIENIHKPEESLEVASDESDFEVGIT